MSQIKSKILNLLASTDISGRYRVPLEMHKTNPAYENLYYHNIDHVRSVLNLFEVLRKLSGKGFDKDQRKSAELAIVFHDFNHTGSPDTRLDRGGLNNIQHAVGAFNQYAAAQNLPYNIRCNVGDIIEGTAYPHIPATGKRYGADVDVEILNLVRDADMLWGTMPGNAEQCMIGMWLERKAAGLETTPIDIAKVLVNQLDFIRNYQPYSAAGRTYKNAMFEDASSAWAMVALEYERGVMAAEVASELSDAEVLKIATGIRNHITQAAQA